MTFRKFENYLLKTGYFARARKLRGVALKCRHGNAIFTKMNLLQNRILLLYINGNNHDNTFTLTSI